jgi:chromosome partitioning protein
MLKIAIYTSKGGAGKSTTAGSLGHAFARRDLRVLLVDADKAANTTAWLGAPPSGFAGPWIEDVILRRGQARDAIIPTRAKGVDMIGSTANLAGAEYELYDGARQGKNPAIALRRGLKDIENDYDVCIIDCPGDFDLIVINVMVCAEVVIIPINPEPFSIDAVGPVLANISDLVAQETIEAKPQILGLITKYSGFDRDAREHAAAIRARTDLTICTSQIVMAENLGRSTGRNQTVFDLAPKSKGAENFDALAAELLAEPAATEAEAVR